MVDRMYRVMNCAIQIVAGIYRIRNFQFHFAKLRENNQLRPDRSALRWFINMPALERNETSLLIIGNPISGITRRDVD